MARTDIMWARIRDGHVVEVADVDPVGRFHPAIVWVEAPLETKEGWIYADGLLAPPPPLSLESLITAKLAALAAKRWGVETGGIEVDGAVIRTDIDSQTKIAGALQMVQRNPETIIDWKGATGWVQLDATAVAVIADLVAAHVQACFTRERVLSDTITAATHTAALDAIDINAGWPQVVA